ncbi:hypothetical protein MAR_028886, partial [Mya arenaria]
MFKTTDINTPESRNWLKQWRAVYITRQALLLTVSDVADQLHGDIVQRVPVPACTTCTSKDVRMKNASCPYHIDIRDELVKEHAYGQVKGIGALTLKNTKAENWVHSPWELAKAREVVNHIRSMPDFSSSALTDQATTECIDNLYALLNEPGLRNRPEATQARKQLDELKTADPSTDEDTRKLTVNRLPEELDTKHPVFDEIRNEVKKLAEVQPYWNEKYPLKWIQLEKTFEQMREQGKVIVNLRDVEAANRENPAPLGSDELQLFLEMQHMYGNILYFDTKELKTSVMLSPQWIIEVFKCFISHKEKHVSPQLVKEWQNYKECAILEPRLLEAIFEHSDRRIRENADVVVEYMKHLDIIAKPIHWGDHDEQVKKEVQDDTSYVDPNNRGPICSKFYILPCLLNAKKGDWEEITKPPVWLNTQALCFVFRDKFMPPAIFHRLLAFCIRTWEIAKSEGKRLLYKGFGVFKVKQAQLRLWYFDHIIYARMSFLSNDNYMKQKEEQYSEKAINRCDCQYVRGQLYRALTAILEILPRSKHVTKTSPFEEYIQCPKLNTHNQGLFRVDDFKINESMSCSDDHEESAPHLIERSILQYWYPEYFNNVQAAQELPEIARGLDDDGSYGMTSALESKRLPPETRIRCEPRTVHWKKVVPSDKQLMNLAKLVGGEWKRLGLQLNLKEPKLQQLNLDHCAKGVVTVVYEMLLVWKKRNARPTLWDLGTCIARSGVSFEWESVPVDVF